VELEEIYTSNVGCGTKTNVRENKMQSRMDNPETLVNIGTQDIWRKQTQHKNKIQLRKLKR